MSTILIVSLGGSNEPVIHAIVETRPDFVHFLCSMTKDGSVGSDDSVEKQVVPAARLACGALAAHG